jgi:hypothetical protein
MNPQCLIFKVSLSETNLVILNGIFDGMCELCNSVKSLSQVNQSISYSTYKRTLLLIRDLIRNSKSDEYYFDAITLKILIKNLNELQNCLIVGGGFYHLMLSDLFNQYQQELKKVLYSLIDAN